MDTGAAVKKTLAFFKIFQHSLSNFELYQWLYSRDKIGLLDIVKEAGRSGIQEARGFFFLSASPSDLPLKRQDRAMDNDKKFAIARRAARLISWAPFISLAAVCNTLSFGAAEKESDIDFFIIARPGRIWLTRLLVSAILSVFNLRRHGRSVTNKICLSFFITEDNLNLSKIALRPDNQGHPDIYLIYWLANLVPLINRDHILEQLRDANNWAFENLANFEFGGRDKNFHEIKVSGWVERTRRFLEQWLGGKTGDDLEKFLKKIQLFKIARHKQSRYFENSSSVVAHDGMLKFHEEDKREFFRNKWKEICAE